MTWRATATALGLLLAAGAFAQEPPDGLSSVLESVPVPTQAGEIVTLRATERVDNELVQFLARNSEPTRLPDDLAGDRTPRDIIRELCGEFRDTYYAEFLSANGLGPLPPDQILAQPIGSLAWPGCLYVSKPPSELAVLPGETAGDLFWRLTGGLGGDLGTTRFFIDRKTPAAEEQVGTATASVARITAPVEFIPRGLDVTDFRREFAALVARSESLRPSAREVAALGGEIVVGEIASASGGCAPQIGPTFEVARLVAAYGHSAGVADSQYRRRGIADVVVVDNGFYGADPRLAADPFAGSPFSRANFRNSPTSTIAESVSFEGVVYPLNYQNNVPVTAVSGHGTHTAGLVLGGPDFADERDGLAGNSPWTRLTILNVGRGERRLIAGAASVLQSLLSGSRQTRIVNMSLAFDGYADTGASAALIRLTRIEDNLYIAAAGNNIRGREVSDAKVYPAALGGVMGRNVVTVAALDGYGRIATFSNWGSAAVDLAAPGCEIRSWLDNGGQVTSLSGTSQAAAQTTMVAAMLSSLWGQATPEEIKWRLVVSGDLLAAEDQARTVFGVRLNPVAALYWFEDYLRVETGPDAGEYLGRMDRLPQLRCGTDPLYRVRDKRDIWAIKRGADGSGRLFHGRNANRVESPCPLVAQDAGVIVFMPTHRLGAGDPVPITTDAPLAVPISQIADLVLGVPRPS